MTTDWPLGLREQLDGTQVGKHRGGGASCDWCHSVLEDGGTITFYAWRTNRRPWYLELASCGECLNDKVGVPTIGCDEVMVKARVKKRERYDGLWLDLEGAEILDHEPPTAGRKDYTEEEVQATLPN